MKKSVVVAFMALLAIELQMVKAATGFDCQAAKLSLVPCIGYLLGGVGPLNVCCGGVRSLKDSTPTPADRRAACECLKPAASQYPGIKSDRAAALPKRCDVQLLCYLQGNELQQVSY